MANINISRGSGLDTRFAPAVSQGIDARLPLAALAPGNLIANTPNPITGLHQGLLEGYGIARQRKLDELTARKLEQSVLAQQQNAQQAQLKNKIDAFRLQHEMDKSAKDSFEFKEIGLPGGKRQVVAINKNDPNKVVNVGDPFSKEADVKFSAPHSGINPTTGKLEDYTLKSDGTVQWLGVQSKPKEQGMQFSLDADGNLTFSENGPITPGLPLTKAAQTDVDKILVNNANWLSRIGDIYSAYDKDLLTLQGRFKTFLSNAAAWIGAETPGDEQRIQAWQVLRTRTFRDLNMLLKERSGAAVSPQEATRLLEELANTGDNPVAFLKKLRETHRFVALAQGRAIRMKMLGIKPTFDKDGNVTSFNGVSLDPDTIKVKSREEAEKLLSANPSLPVGAVLEIPNGEFFLVEPK